tara:strand:+ start:677 stop:901 length:225 start_codon:yes stop_codon:yes gene_type:complete
MGNDKITQEEILHHYTAMGHSVCLINRLLDEGSDDEDTQTSISCNVEHLKLMLDKDFWTDEDFSSVNEVIKRAT